MHAETIIIGGGVVGASVAYHLTMRGCRDVLVLERERTLGSGSTGRATGGIRAQFETEINIRLSLYSLDFFRDWEINCGYEPRGYLFVATDDTQMQFLQTGCSRQRALGYSEVEIIDKAAVAEIVPGLNCQDIVGGSFGPRDGFIDPMAIVEGFSSRAVHNGARIRTGIDVTSISVRNGKAVGVETSAGKLECDNVVLCSGAWAQRLAATAEIHLPVEPKRRQIVWARTKDDLPPNLPMVIDLSDGFHFRPAKNSVNEVLFAYPDPQQIAGFNTEFDDDFVGKVYKRASHRAPFLADTTVLKEKCRAGLYENTPDHHAILGKCVVGGLYLANGFSGHGVMHSPATGRALAEIIIDGRATFLDVSSLSLDRFENGELLHETAFI
jgi:sarcosine oxidase, subunit beta